MLSWMINTCHSSTRKTALISNGMSSGMFNKSFSISNSPIFPLECREIRDTFIECDRRMVENPPTKTILLISFLGGQNELR